MRTYHYMSLIHYKCTNTCGWTTNIREYNEKLYTFTRTTCPATSIIILDLQSCWTLLMSVQQMSVQKHSSTCWTDCRGKLKVTLPPAGQLYSWQDASWPKGREAKQKPKRKNARFKMLKSRFKVSGQTKIYVVLKEIQVKLFDLFTLHCNLRNYQFVFLQRLHWDKINTIKSIVRFFVQFLLIF